MASAVRTIVVLPKCSVGEFLCQDEISCSSDRVCLSDDVSSDSGNGSEEDPSVQALTLTLIGPATMRVKQARIPALWPSNLTPTHNEFASYEMFHICYCPTDATLRKLPGWTGAHGGYPV